MKTAFDKIFGDMSLSENDVALSIFEYGYKAGMDARRQWVGLTDEERDHLWSITPPEYEDQFAFVLAVEAKLKEKNHD